MKFTLIKDLNQDPMMKPILSGLLIFTFFYLIADIIIKHYNFGVLPSSISITLFGSEEEFIDPITKSSFLEIWHTDIFFIMMVLLSLSATFIRLTRNNKKNLLILNITLISSMLSLIALSLAFFVSSSFILLYSISLFTWHLLALYMAISSFWNLYNA